MPVSQRGIVVPAAHTQPISRLIKAHQGHEQQIELTRAQIVRINWFGNTVFIPCLARIVAQASESHDAAALGNNWQITVQPHSLGLFQERSDVEFATVWEVKAYSAGTQQEAVAQRQTRQCTCSQSASGKGVGLSGRFELAAQRQFVQQEKAPRLCRDELLTLEPEFKTAAVKDALGT